MFLRGPGYSVPAGVVTTCPLYLQTASTVPSPNFVSVVIPANTLTASGEYTLTASFNAIVDIRPNAALPGSNNNARFLSATTVSVKAVTPVFPMAVTSSITSQSASASAAIQFRPQDVGTTASVFTLPWHPRPQVKAAVRPSRLFRGQALSPGREERHDHRLAWWRSSPPPAQLIAVTTAQLQAYSSGALSASGASVTLLNNASTPTVAGATFYVGYGASSSAMLTNGIYRNAVTVPGASVCPMLSSQTALFWNPAESGWGLNLNHQGNTLFGTLFTYEASRAPCGW